MTGIPERLVRAIGADPDVFFPIARAHALIVRRRAGILRARRGLLSKTSPFRTLCMFAVVYGLAGTLFIAESKSSLLGEAIALTIGCLFLVMVVVSDYFDVLVNPREQMLLGSHPHDDRSILLAKSWVVGRSLAILFLFLFLPTTLTVLLIGKSVLYALLYFVAAASAATTASLAGLYVGVTVLTLFGRAGYDRMMPWLQTLFQISYFVFFGGRTLMTFMGKASVSPLLVWLYPPFWFLAPVEAAYAGGWTIGAAGRAMLAAAALFGLAAGGSRWLGSRMGERLLEPIRPPARRAPKSGAPSRSPARVAGTERGRFFALFRIHMRSDWRTRSEFFMGPVICAAVLLTSYRDRSPWFGAFLVGCFLIASMDVLTRSARPESLWILLVSPIDRVRFSLASVSLIRVAQLLPMVLILAVLGRYAPGETVGARALFSLEILLYGDLLVLVGRGLLPEFPFSRPARSDGAGGRRMVMILLGTLLSGVGILAMWTLDRFASYGVVIAIAGMAVLHLPAAVWMRRRGSAAARDIELLPASVA